MSHLQSTLDPPVLTARILQALEQPRLQPLLNEDERQLLEQLATNLAKAGSVNRWFRSSAAGETPRPEVVSRILHDLTLPAELAPQLVRIVQPEGPARRQSLEVALRHADPHADPFQPHAEENPMREQIAAHLNGHAKATNSLITPPQKGSKQEMVHAHLERLGYHDLRQNIPLEVQKRIAAELGCTWQNVKDHITRLRRAQDIPSLRKHATHKPRPAVAAPAPAPPPAPTFDRAALATQAAAQLLQTGSTDDARLAAQLLLRDF